jgi:hypothetical protein
MASARQHFDQQDKSVYAQVALDRVPITALPYHAVRDFLGTVASLVTSDEPNPHGGKSEYEDAVSIINYDLAETMWGVLQDYTLNETTTGGELAVAYRALPNATIILRRSRGRNVCVRGAVTLCGGVPEAYGLRRLSRGANRHRASHRTWRRPLSAIRQGVPRASDRGLPADCCH